MKYAFISAIADGACLPTKRCHRLISEFRSAPGISSQAAPAAIPTDQENVRKAHAILDQAIQALGGQAYLNVQDMTQEGRSYTFHHGEPNSLGTLFWRFRKFPDKDRIELTKKRDVIELYTGDKGYEITYRGVRNMDDKEMDPVPAAQAFRAGLGAARVAQSAGRGAVL